MKIFITCLICLSGYITMIFRVNIYTFVQYCWANDAINCVTIGKVGHFITIDELLILEYNFDGFKAKSEGFLS